MAGIMENPYESPKVEIAPVSVANSIAEKRKKKNKHPGIERNPYVGIIFGMAFTQSILMEVARANELIAPMLFTFVLFWLLSLIAVYYRLKNIGVNPAWCVLMLVPVLNLFIGFFCMICQEGYAETKKLDGPGRVTAIIGVGVFLAGLIFVVMAFVILRLGI